MITKRHIRQYLDKLSLDIPGNHGQVSDYAWQQLHEYLVEHYKRLDKRARAYADEIFDSLDAGLKQRIASLPKGREKKGLSRKLSMVQGKRSPVPVLYLDTPVLESLIRHGLGQAPSERAGGSAEALYEEVLALVRDGKLICPEDTFRREALQMGDKQAWEGLNIMKRLSEGLSFKHSQSIEDFQVFRALCGFIGGNGSVNYREFWQDAFDGQTVRAIRKKRSSITFKGPLALAETPEDAGEPVPPSTRLRIRYDETARKNERELQERSTRHLRELVRLGMRYETIRGEAQKRHINGFWAGQKIDLSVSLWNHYGGKPEGLEGLISFYESEHFRDVPAIRNKRDIWNAFSANHTEGSNRVTVPPDINTMSAIFPYTDIMILGRKMTEAVRDTLGLDSRFDTEIYSIDEQDLIVAALKEMTD